MLHLKLWAAYRVLRLLTGNIADWDRQRLLGCQRSMSWHREIHYSAVLEQTFFLKTLLKLRHDHSISVSELQLTHLGLLMRA